MNALRSPIRLLVLIAFIPLLFAWADSGREAHGPTTTRKPVLLRIGPDEDRIGAIAFSPDGNLLAAASGGNVLLWELPSGKLVGCVPVPANGAPCRFLTFSSDGNRLATVHYDRPTHMESPQIGIWHVVGNSLRFAHTIPVSPPLGSDCEKWRVSFSPDGKTLVGASPNRSLLLWDVATGRGLLHFYGGVAAAFLPDGRSLLSVGAFGRIHRWEAGTNRLLDPANAKPPSEIIVVQTAVFSPDRRLVVLGDGAGHVFWIKDTATGQIRCRVETASQSHPLVFSPDGRLLALVSYRYGVSLFDTATGKEQGWANGYHAAAFSSDGRWFAWLRDDGIVVEPTSTFLTEGRKAPTPPATEPPGVPLQIEWIANQKTYTLDRGGLTPEEFANEFLDGEIAPPEVDLTLRLKNTGDRPLRFHRSGPLQENIYVDLHGPGAINYFQLRQTGLNTNSEPEKPVDFELLPGAVYSARMKVPMRDVVWTVPGEYRLRVDFFIDVSPAPKGTEADKNGFGSVWLRGAPLAIRVVLPKKASAQRVEMFHSEPPLGSLVPPPEDRATRRTRRKLDQKANLEKGLEAGQSLKDVMDFLRDRYEIDWAVDEPAFGKLGKPRFGQTKIGGLARMIGTPLDAVLYLLLNPLGADFEIRSGKLWIVPLAKPKNLAECFGNAHSWFRNKLQKPRTIPEIAAGTPLQEALERLSLELDNPILIDTPAFTRAGIKNMASKPARLAEQTDVPLRTILERLLQPLGATFLIRDNVIVVLPRI